MMVNPDAGSYTETLIHRKILGKTQKKSMKTKRMLKPKLTFTFTVA